MTPVPARPTPRSSRRLALRVGALAGLLLTAAAAAVTTVAAAVPAAATISGYGVVGPDPATDLGFSRPVLGTSVIGPAGGSFVAAGSGSRTAVTIPPGMFGGHMMVSVVDLTDADTAKALLPGSALSGRTVSLGIGLGIAPVDIDTASAAGPAAAAASSAGGRVTVDIGYDPVPGGRVYLVTGDTVTELTTDPGTIVISAAGPFAVFVLGPAAVVTTTGPSGRTARASGALAATGGDVTAPIVVGLVLLLGGTAVVAAARRRRT